MSDKEVGELWRRCHDALRDGDWIGMEHECQWLIRKLVAVRWQYNREKWNWPDNLCLQAALAKYGIDPNTWGEP